MPRGEKQEAEKILAARLWREFPDHGKIGQRLKEMKSSVVMKKLLKDLKETWKSKVHEEKWNGVIFYFFSFLF